MELGGSRGVWEFTHRGLSTRESLTRAQLASRLSRALDEAASDRRVSPLPGSLSDSLRFFDSAAVERGRLKRVSPRGLESALANPPSGVSEEALARVGYHLYAELTTRVIHARARAVRSRAEQGRVALLRLEQKRKAFFLRHSMNISLDKDRSEPHARLVAEQKVDPRVIKMPSLAALLACPAVAPSCVNRAYSKMFSDPEFELIRRPSK